MPRARRISIWSATTPPPSLPSPFVSLSFSSLLASLRFLRFLRSHFCERPRKLVKLWSDQTYCVDFLSRLRPKINEINSNSFERATSILLFAVPFFFAGEELNRTWSIRLFMLIFLSFEQSSRFDEASIKDERLMK